MLSFVARNRFFGCIITQEIRFCHAEESSSLVQVIKKMHMCVGKCPGLLCPWIRKDNGRQEEEEEKKGTRACVRVCVCSLARRLNTREASPLLWKRPIKRTGWGTLTIQSSASRRPWNTGASKAAKFSSHLFLRIFLWKSRRRCSRKSCSVRQWWNDSRDLSMPVAGIVTGITSSSTWRAIPDITL